MKKHLFIFASMCFAFSVSAQITLTQNDVSHSSSYSFIRHFNTSGITIPTHGTNITYDYSSLGGSTVDTIPYMPATRTSFTGFTRFSYGAAFLSSIPLYSEYYTHMDANGLASVGSYKLEQSVGIGIATGNNSDTLSFPGNATIFTSPAYDIKFPATYESEWTSDYFYHTDFLLTVSAFSLNNTPGFQKQYLNQTDSIVGWGSIILTTDNGASIPYDVLLIKQSRLITDSIYLGGSPAPQTLLDAFGITQGQQWNQNTYTFVAAGFEMPLLTINMSDNWSTAVSSFYSRENLQPVSLEADLDMPSVNVFPIPVQAASVLNFSGVQAFETSDLTIYDAMGKQICKHRVNSNSAGDIQWNVPADMKQGSYFYTLTDLKNETIVSGKWAIN